MKSNDYYLSHDLPEPLLKPRKPSANELLENPAVGEEYKAKLARYEAGMKEYREISRRHAAEFWCDLRDELDPDRDFSDANWNRIIEYVRFVIDPTFYDIRGEVERVIDLVKSLAWPLNQ